MQYDSEINKRCDSIIAYKIPIRKLMVKTQYVILKHDGLKSIILCYYIITVIIFSYFQTAKRRNLMGKEMNTVLYGPERAHKIEQIK